MILVYLVIALAAWIGLNLCVFLWLYFQAYSRCETLAKVQCHETVTERTNSVFKDRFQLHREGASPADQLS
jgi:hypothetical protein